MIKKNIDIIIRAEFGSEKQRVLAMDSLKMGLETWQFYINRWHKKNKVEVKVLIAQRG